MNQSKKSYSVLFALVLLILIALQGYYIYNSYKLEEKELKTEASKVALNVFNEMDRLKRETDEDKLIEGFKKLSHDRNRQFDELKMIQSKAGIHHKILNKTVDSLLNYFSKDNGYEIALRKDVYSIYDEINHKELLLKKPIVVYNSTAKIQHPQNINQSVWASDDINNQTDSDLGIDKNERHKYKIKSKADFELLNARFLILKKIIPLLLISLLIVTLIVYLFWKSIKNLSKQQQKNAQLHLTIDSIAHELNTPITTLKFALQQINHSETKDVMMRQVDRLENTVDSIFSDNEAEADLLSETNLNEMMKSVKKQFSTVNIQFSLNFENNLHLTTKDFKQILINLIENSAKYGSENVFLDFNFTEIISLRFLDDGIGIPPEDLLHVFDKYYRVNRLVNQNINGLGLGLYLVNNTVKKYSGEISVKNNEKNGVEFLIKIPNEN